LFTFQCLTQGSESLLYRVEDLFDVLDYLFFVFDLRVYDCNTFFVVGVFLLLVPAWCPALTAKIYLSSDFSGLAILCSYRVKVALYH
tara:strand:+ start:1230 stop:1490 length:261 start_codon:yes stop_codon:yes gene_type:complete